MAQHETIHDLADRAVSAPEGLSHPDIVRLGAWVVDRQEHIAAHRQALAEASGQAAPPAPSPLVRRMPPPASAPAQIAPQAPAADSEPSEHDAGASTEAPVEAEHV